MIFWYIKMCYIFNINNVNFWYQKFFFDIRKSFFFYIRKWFVDIKYFKFFISENLFFYIGEKRYYLISRIQISDIKNRLFDIKKWFLDIRKFFKNIKIAPHTEGACVQLNLSTFSLVYFSYTLDMLIALYLSEGMMYRFFETYFDIPAIICCAHIVDVLDEEVIKVQ